MDAFLERVQVIAGELFTNPFIIFHTDVIGPHYLLGACLTAALVLLIGMCMLVWHDMVNMSSILALVVALLFSAAIWWLAWGLLAIAIALGSLMLIIYIPAKAFSILFHPPKIKPPKPRPTIPLSE